MTVVVYGSDTVLGQLAVDDTSQDGKLTERRSSRGILASVSAVVI